MTKVERLEAIRGRLLEMTDQIRDKREELDVYEGVLAEMLSDLRGIEIEVRQEFMLSSVGPFTTNPPQLAS